MNQILGLILLALAIGVSLVAFFAVLNLFFPQRIAKTRMLIEKTPGRSFLVGLVNLAFFLIVILVLSSLGKPGGNWPVQLVALIIIVPLGLGLIFGLAGIVQFAGERLAPQASELPRTAWGALGLGLACALPFAGWFGLLPFVAMLGLGALISSFFYRERRTEQQEEPEES